MTRSPRFCADADQSAPTAPGQPDPTTPAEPVPVPPDSEPHAPIEEPGETPQPAGDPRPTEPMRLL